MRLLLGVNPRGSFESRKREQSLLWVFLGARVTPVSVNASWGDWEGEAELGRAGAVFAAVLAPHVSPFVPQQP